MLHAGGSLLENALCCSASTSTTRHRRVDGGRRGTHGIADARYQHPIHNNLHLMLRWLGCRSPLRRRRRQRYVAQDAAGARTEDGTRSWTHKKTQHATAPHQATAAARDPPYRTTRALTRPQIANARTQATFVPDKATSKPTSSLELDNSKVRAPRTRRATRNSSPEEAPLPSRR